MPGELANERVALGPVGDGRLVFIGMRWQLARCAGCCGRDRRGARDGSYYGAGDWPGRAALFDRWGWVGRFVAGRRDRSILFVRRSIA
jgi:hypothetical protein